MFSWKLVAVFFAVAALLQLSLAAKGGSDVKTTKAKINRNSALHPKKANSQKTGGGRSGSSAASGTLTNAETTTKPVNSLNLNFAPALEKIE